MASGNRMNSLPIMTLNAVSTARYSDTALMTKMWLLRRKLGPFMELRRYSMVTGLCIHIMMTPERFTIIDKFKGHISRLACRTFVSRRDPFIT